MGSPDRILSAAENVFARFGYRRASMSQIAEEAGLTRQALYHHYAGKEALFRAVVEQLHELAYEAEAAAGLEQEQAGAGLADILAAQIGARFRYLLECVEESPQAEELLSEHQLQTRDLYQSFVEHNAELRAETIDRVCARQGICLQQGMTPRELARCIQLAIRGLNDLRLDASVLHELDRMVRLLVAGAIASATPKPRSRRKSR
jgi:AcrR family transcriptional regulator